MRLQPFTNRALAVLVVVPLLLIGALVVGSRWSDASATGPGTTTQLPSGQLTDGTTASSTPTPTRPAPAGTETAATQSGNGDTGTASPPGVDAAAYLVADPATGEVLAELAGDEPRGIGSITKLMTAWVVMQAGNLDDTAGVPPLDPDSEESRIGLEPGTVYRRDVLLRAMLIVSASDAARALAVDVAGSEEAFVDMMNDEAAALGLDGTHFAGPVGLDHPDNHSTARDVARLAMLLMQDPTFRETAARRDATLHGETIPATNDLLTSYPGADGIKTGHTDEAGWCIAASATREGRQFVVVVLGSSTRESRNAAATTLLDWAFAR